MDPASLALTAGPEIDDRPETKAIGRVLVFESNAGPVGLAAVRSVQVRGPVELALDHVQPAVSVDVRDHQTPAPSGIIEPPFRCLIGEEPCGVLDPQTVALLSETIGEVLPETEHDREVEISIVVHISTVLSPKVQMLCVV